MFKVTEFTPAAPAPPPPPPAFVPSDVPPEFPCPAVPELAVMLFAAPPPEPPLFPAPLDIVELPPPPPPVAVDKPDITEFDPSVPFALPGLPAPPEPTVMVYAVPDDNEIDAVNKPPAPPPPP
jgi:hypothetical protein